MLTVTDARARILASLTPTPPETVALAGAGGRVLAAPVIARLTQPPADVSAMDGFALRARDAPAGAKPEHEKNPPYSPLAFAADALVERVCHRHDDRFWLADL